MAYIASLRIDIPVSEMTPDQRRIYNNEKSKAAYYRRRDSKGVKSFADHEKFMTDVAHHLYRKHGPAFPTKFMELAQRALNNVIAHNNKDTAQLNEAARPLLHPGERHAADATPIRLQHHAMGTWWAYRGEKLPAELAEVYEKLWVAGEALPPLTEEQITKICNR